MSFKNKLKEKLVQFPLFWQMYESIKMGWLRIYNLRYFFYDISNTYSSMHWSKKRVSLSTLSSELLFNYHKLEKGLVMPGEKRLFGLVPVKRTIELLRVWDEMYPNKREQAVYQGAVGTLQSYRKRILEYDFDREGLIIPIIDAYLNKNNFNSSLYLTPKALTEVNADFEINQRQFNELMKVRRSVREFLPKHVDKELILESVKTAQLAPSACNRQPCSIVFVSDERKKKELLSLQNGNAGFGHLAPHIAVILADQNCFFGASERHEPYVDGGLFSMSFILALRSNNISSCCLNWCVQPNTDRKAQKLLELPSSKRIIMLIAFGYAPEHISVPLSPRRDLSSIVSFIERN